jgi:hypothetical protein
MALEHVSQGFIAHLLGGLIGAVVGWSIHVLYRRLKRGSQHAQFDREIVGFAKQLQTLVASEKMPAVMARVVPLACKATFGTEEPPLKETYTIPHGTILGCKLCKRRVEPTSEGRCPTCKLGCSSYHVPVADL